MRHKSVNLCSTLLKNYCHQLIQVVNYVFQDLISLKKQSWHYFDCLAGNSNILATLVSIMFTCNGDCVISFWSGTPGFATLEVACFKKFLNRIYYTMVHWSKNDLRHVLGKLLNLNENIHSDFWNDWSTCQWWLFWHQTI